MIFITDELGKFEKNIIELAENVGFKECKTIEAIDLFCGISEKNDVLKEKDLYYAFIETPQYWSIRADGINGAIYDNKTKMANIYFKNPIEKRMVSRVEWIDRNNTVYRIDYYNKYGYKYCSENVRGGNVISREFYDRNGDIKVIEQTGPKTYTLLGTGISPRSYRGFADYLEAYLKYNEIYDENIWLTSDDILNKFAGDYGNFKISYLPQNRLNSDLTETNQTNTAFRILCSEEQQVKAHLYGRTFFNEDGSVCYEEVIEDDSTFYRIGAQVLYTKADLVGYMVKRLNLTADDVVIIDRTTGIGQAILENCGPARVGIVVHADHFSEGGTDDDYILWNNYYEYSFSQTEHIDFYITATDAQNEIMRQQFKKYCGKEPHVVTIPVGSLDELKYPDEPRKRHSLITASRLATEKHCDWLVEAVVKAKESVPDISLDIYGKGGDEAKLKGLIGRLGCADYVHLMGQQKLDDVYKHYDAYVAASQSEGFGLTLMEAIGSGLPIVGFDVRYGNQTFIDDGQNGYKIPITDEMDQKEKIKLLSERIVRMFTEDDMDAFSAHSYEKAKEYLTKEVVHRWIELLK